MSYKRLTLSSVVGIFCFLGLRCIDYVHAGKTQDAEIEDMISSMTLQQQINQMAQIDVNLLFQGDLDGQIGYFIGDQAYGSILVDNVYVDAPYFNEVMSKVQKVAKANNLPPVLPAIDAVHGANTIKNAILFPQQINLGCTFNPEYAKYSGKITARDTLASGFSWLYSPIIGLGIQPLWGRVFETFGEDPHLVGKMGTKLVEGIQENGKSAACVKHFVGYSDPRDGHDRAPSWIPTRHLYQYFVRPWRDVIENAKPLSVMESYTEYDGVPNVANQFSLKTLLREDLGFEGVLVSDYHEVENLFQFHHVAVDNNEAVMMALMEGSLDVSMIPWDFWTWSDGVMAAINEVNGTKSQGVIKERIKQSLRRILKMKHDLGMFDEDTYVESAKDLDLIGDPEVRKEALKIARESIVLAKNNYMTLPVAMRDGIGREIDKKIKVHVTGPSSDSLPYQCGGWTIHWQGAYNNGEFSYGRTVLDAAKDNDKWEVTSSCGVDINGASCEDENLDSLVAERKEADYIIVCIGEENHAEKGGDIFDPFLPQGQRDFVERLKKNTSAKIIVVYFGGRPRLLGSIVDSADSVVLAFLPGPDGGQAVVDLLAGDANFSGKLPITYPLKPDLSGAPYWHAITDQCPGWAGHCPVQFKFGHGLSYTRFQYSSFEVDTDEVVYALPWSDNANAVNATFSINVKNVGSRAGIETVMFFLFPTNRHVTPEYKLLVHFERVELQPGENQTVSYDVTPETLRYVGPHDETHDILQMGERFKIGVGPSADCGIYIGTCSDFITLKLSDEEEYDSACETACSVLDEHSCLVNHSVSQQQCYEKCLSSPSTFDVNKNGWGWNYVNCIESILLDKTRSSDNKCHNVDSLCRNVFVADATSVTEEAKPLRKVLPESALSSDSVISEESASGMVSAFTLCGVFVGTFFAAYALKGARGAKAGYEELPTESSSLVL